MLQVTDVTLTHTYNLSGKLDKPKEDMTCVCVCACEGDGETEIKTLLSKFWQVKKPQYTNSDFLSPKNTVIIVS